MKNIAILGSTGSIGVQTLEVIEDNPDKFSVEVLTANNNVELLVQQAKRFKPNSVVIGNDEKYSLVCEFLKDEDIKVYAGAKAIEQIVESSNIDIVLTAMVGYSGLLPTINAIKSGKTIALANKETLVVAGELINKLVQKHKVAILPVDSEHSAIFQCLIGEGNNQVEKIILTASGGPFRGRNKEQLMDVTVDEALRHPSWKMGAKITIDSASMMNKGFEVIEAKWLFGVRPSQIDVLVHPQAVIHSMVQFKDGSIKAQLGVPDMRIPIQYALTFPERSYLDVDRLDFDKINSFTFERPDLATFRNLRFAYDALKKGGNLACILNAANEIVVEAFLNKKISFIQMSDIIEETLSNVCFIEHPNLDDYINTDKETRRVALEYIK